MSDDLVFIGDLDPFAVDAALANNAVGSIELIPGIEGPITIEQVRTFYGGRCPYSGDTIASYWYDQRNGDDSMQRVIDHLRATGSVDRFDK